MNYNHTETHTNYKNIQCAFAEVSKKQAVENNLKMPRLYTHTQTHVRSDIYIEFKHKHFMIPKIEFDLEQMCTEETYVPIFVNSKQELAKANIWLYFSLVER